MARSIFWIASLPVDISLILNWGATFLEVFLLLGLRFCSDQLMCYWDHLIIFHGPHPAPIQARIISCKLDVSKRQLQAGKVTIRSVCNLAALENSKSRNESVFIVLPTFVFIWHFVSLECFSVRLFDSLNSASKTYCRIICKLYYFASSARSANKKERELFRR